MKKYLLILLFLLPLNSYSHSLFIEPFAGYNFYGNAGYAPNYDATGYNYGLRAGYMYKRIFVGLDYNLSQLERAEINESSFANELAVIIGIEFPQQVRAWVGGVVTGIFEDDTTGTVKGASGFKFGLGYAVYNYWNINLEMKTIKYDSYDPSVFASFNHVATSLSISFPWEIEIKRIRNYIDL